MKPGTWRGLMIVAAATYGCVAPAADTIYVAALEDLYDRECPTTACPEKQIRQIRFLFRKDAQGWKWHGGDPVSGRPSSTDHLDVPFTWHIAIDGRHVGVVQSRPRRPDEPDHPRHAYTQVLTTPARGVPRLDKGTGEYNYGGAMALSRPLLAISAPNVSDPERWKPAKLDAGERRTLLAAFRRQVPQLRQCDEPEQGGRLIDYEDKDVLVHSSYRDRNGRVIASAELDEEKSGCYYYDDELFYDYWFVLEPDGSIRVFGELMEPVEAVDMDGDGRSEWLFIKHPACGSGYRLYVDGLTKEIN